MDQKPSIGRTVHVYPGLYPGDQLRYAAIISAVHENDAVDVHVFPGGGASSFPIQKVSSVKNRSDDPNATFWEWPPRS